MNLNRVINIERYEQEVSFIDFDLRYKGEYTLIQNERPQSNIILHEAVYHFVTHSGRFFIVAKSAPAVCTDIRLLQNGKWAIKFELLENYIKRYMKKRPDPWAVKTNDPYNGKQMKL